MRRQCASFRLPPSRGSLHAQNNLAAMYAYGQGVPRASPRAARWQRLAADQGYAIAQYNLGMMYTTAAAYRAIIVLAYHVVLPCRCPG